METTCLWEILPCRMTGKNINFFRWCALFGDRYGTLLVQREHRHKKSIFEYVKIWAEKKVDR